MIHSAVRRLIAGTVTVTPQRLLRTVLKTIEQRPDLAESIGYHVYPREYYAPLPSRQEVDLAILERKREFPDIALNQQKAAALLETLRPYVGELDAVPYEQLPGEPFHFANAWYNDFDAATLYGILRHLKPRHYAELGCGFSSVMSFRALSRNVAEGFPCDALYADPAPRVEIAEVLKSATVIRRRVQDVPIDVFARLEAGDALFVDTSHVVKLQGDVVHLLGKVLPLLKPGVWIHFHDVLTPYDYPVDWVEQPLFADNEQYALEALLNGGDRYVVELPLYLLWKEQFALLKNFFPRGHLRPLGFWIRKQH